MQTCPLTNSSCQGNNQDPAIENIYAGSVYTNNTQVWQEKPLANNTFALQTTAASVSCPNGALGCCVDVCANSNCGSNQGNIILYGCHFMENQQWRWYGNATADGGRLLQSVRSSKCVTACPAANSQCAFAGDVSTVSCNTTDPYQRWVYLS